MIAAAQAIALAATVLAMIETAAVYDLTLGDLADTPRRLPL